MCVQLSECVASIAMCASVEESQHTHETMCLVYGEIRSSHIARKLSNTTKRVPRAMARDRVSRACIYVFNINASVCLLHGNNARRRHTIERIIYARIVGDAKNAYANQPTNPNGICIAHPQRVCIFTAPMSSCVRLCVGCSMHKTID